MYPYCFVNYVTILYRSICPLRGGVRVNLSPAWVGCAARRLFVKIFDILIKCDILYLKTMSSNAIKNRGVLEGEKKFSKTPVS